MTQLIKFGALILATSILAACGGSNDDDDGGGNNGVDTGATPTPPTTTPSPPTTTDNAQFEITVTNLTNAQPLSPVAVVLHSEGYHAFVDGETASAALELLAEGGDNTQVLQEAQAAAEHIASGSTEGPVPPQTISPAVSLSVPADDVDSLQLTLITMLVHTNDAFTGTNAASIAGMAVGDSRTLTAPTWDSGTEANTETRATIPGPDFGGEGFSADRDDLIDRVRFHQSVVTSESADFGLATSDLQDRHRFLNPTSRVVVTRVQ